MARKGRLDRGLMQKKDVNGRIVWYVRLYHNGRERRFGSFPTKTKAREFYEKAKREQTEEKFQPERYQKGRLTVAELIDPMYPFRPLKTTKPKPIMEGGGRHG